MVLVSQRTMSFSFSSRPTILGRLRTATTIEYIPAALLLLLLLFAFVVLLFDRLVAGLGDRRNSLLRVDTDYGDVRREERRLPRGGLSYVGVHAGLSYYITYAGECDPAPRTRLYTASIVLYSLPKFYFDIKKTLNIETEKK